MEFVPSPTATHRVPFQATPLPAVKMLVLPVTGVHVIPSDEYAMVFVPEPTATHRVPFQATPLPAVEKILLPNPVHVIPSDE